MEWFKALHVISVIAWMAGLLYLPRLYVYHSDEKVGSQSSELFKVMERRLYRGIMTPAAIASWLFGLILLISYQVFDFLAFWSWSKLILVVILSAMHLWLGHFRKLFADDHRPLSSHLFRWINEVPTVLMILIVILIIVRPF